jgi:hypothetical protein
MEENGRSRAELADTQPGKAADFASPQTWRVKTAVGTASSVLPLRNQSSAAPIRWLLSPSVPSMQLA